MIRIRQLKIGVCDDNDDVLIDMICHKLKIRKDNINSFKILKKSIDARDKKNIFYVYDVLVDCERDDVILRKNKDSNICSYEEESYSLTPCGSNLLGSRVVVIGSGPCGLFCSYMLASWGYKPLIIERGDMIDERIRKVNDFFESGVLDVNSNIQFGEGGAGTFSDGKLNTLNKDKFHRQRKVFEIFVECGAPAEIMYENMPHIGTDVLRSVISNMREKIISMGGDFLFNSCVTDLVVEDGHLRGVVVNGEKIISTDVAVLAIGHSARDTFYMLNEKNVLMKNKNFAVGFRIEHPKEMIDRCQYGDFANILPSASYKLVHQCSNGRSVYSFCMCPGGFVVNASSEESCLCVNGMSNYKRDEKNSNSAIVVNVLADEFGASLFSGVEFQRKIEALAYKEGLGNIPVQLYKDFCGCRISSNFGSFTPNVKGKYSFGNLNNILPDELCSSIKEGIEAFGKKIPGFSRDDAILLGVEARTSSPITIVRDDNFESNILGLYPCGEGAGYAGGITTAAIDGVKVAEAIASKYCF